MITVAYYKETKWQSRVCLSKLGQDSGVPPASLIADTLPALGLPLMDPTTRPHRAHGICGALQALGPPLQARVGKEVGGSYISTELLSCLLGAAFSEYLLCSRVQGGSSHSVC